MTALFVLGMEQFFAPAVSVLTTRGLTLPASLLS